MAELKGSYLKIDETANDEGVCFISTRGGGEVKASYFHQNFPKKLLFQIPDLTVGTYKVEVRSRGHNCKTLKGVLGVDLMVA